MKKNEKLIFDSPEYWEDLTRKLLGMGDRETIFPKDIRRAKRFVRDYLSFADKKDRK